MDGDRGDGGASAGRERFSRRARWWIGVALAVMVVAGTVQRRLWPEDESPRFAETIGQPYTDVFLFFGAPQRESDDGRGGLVAHYDEWVVAGDHFDLREFRFYVSADGRIYRFERD